MAFIHAGGTIVKKELRNDTILVDTGCIVAFTAGIKYDIQRAGNLKSMFFGGEGLFLATLSGTGVVMLQSLPFSRMADRINARSFPMPLPVKSRRYDERFWEELKGKKKKRSGDDALREMGF